MWICWRRKQLYLPRRSAEPDRKMSLTEKYGSHLPLFSSFSANKIPAATAGPLKPFEEILTARLRSLLPIPDCSLPLPWLSRAVHLLSITIADAVSIISATTHLPAISSHLHSTLALLDACNAISAAADRILRGRLLLFLSLRLLSSSPDCRRRAMEWKALASAPHLPCCSTDLLRRLRPIDPNRGRLTAARRAIYAVEAFSYLVVRASLAVLGERWDAQVVGIRASDHFPWAAAYSELDAAVSAKLLRGKRADEVEEAEASVGRVAALVDKDEEEELHKAVRGAEKAMEELREGMSGLGDAVNGLFRAGLEARNAAVQCFRGGGEV